MSEKQQSEQSVIYYLIPWVVFGAVFFFLGLQVGYNQGSYERHESEMRLLEAERKRTEQWFDKYMKAQYPVHEI